MHRPRSGSIRLPLYENGDTHQPRPKNRSESPSRRKRRRSTVVLPNQRTVLSLFKFALAATALVALFLFWLWEVHVEIMFYRRSWITNDVKKIEPLSGCFSANKISPFYNYTRAREPKTNEVQAGFQLRFGLDCYDFAGTIQPLPHSTSDSSAAIPPPRNNFHTYWRVDLVPFAERQTWMLKSFFATQDLARSNLILWSNGDLSNNPNIQPFLRAYPDSFEVRIVDVDELASETALERSKLLRAKDKRAWTDGDLVRLLVTWAHGGVWVDMDTLFTRDLTPLLEHEFVTQWDCYDKMYQPLNGALMHFYKHSPYLCEMFHIMSRSPAPRSGTTDWGSTLYLKLWRRLVSEGIPPFKVLPFCFTDARSCRQDNRLPDPFKADPKWWADGKGLKEGGPLDDALNKVFSVHLHNQWDKKFPKDGWVERLLLKRYDWKLAARARDAGHYSPV